MSTAQRAYPNGRRAALLGAAALGLLVAQQPWNAVLTGPAAPHGIVSFELAGSAAQADAMLAQWTAAGVTGTAWWLMAIDLGYPILYAVALDRALAWATRGRPSRWRLAPLGAAAMDYAENAALIAQLAQGRGSGWAAAVAAGAAFGKFVLILMSVTVVIVSVVRRRA
jgi:hypothetical protein